MSTYDLSILKIEQRLDHLEMMQGIHHSIPQKERDKILAMRDGDRIRLGVFLVAIAPMIPAYELGVPWWQSCLMGALILLAYIWQFQSGSNGLARHRYTEPAQDRKNISRETLTAAQ